MTNTPVVVAFTGRRGAGKSAAAAALVDLGFRDVKFADPLKNMLRAFFSTVWMRTVDIERHIEGDLKEVPTHWLGDNTTRYAMQMLGTEWRDLIDTDLWSKILRYRVTEGHVGQKVVISDYRFPHEGVILRELGGKVIRIVGRGEHDDETAQHISETSIDDLVEDFILTNDGDLDDLHEKVKQLAEEQGWLA
jgi:hypothetical protein